MKLATAAIAALFCTAFSLSAVAQPANDNFADRISLTGNTNVVSVSTTDATAEPGEPNEPHLSVLESVWYQWTAPQTGTAHLYYSGDSYYRQFAVYTGTKLTGLHGVGDVTMGLTFEVKEGQVFQIQAMASTTTPDFFMHIELATPPQNDNFADRLELDGTVIDVDGDNSAATRESDEPKHNGVNYGRSLWYSWTAPATGWLFVDVTNGPSLVCEPYTGNSIHKLRPVNGILVDATQFIGVAAVDQGVQYQLAVDGTPYFAKVVHTGPFALHLRFSGLTLFAPTNNAIFTSASEIDLNASDIAPAVDGAFSEVTFYAYNILTGTETVLGTSQGPPFNLAWTNPTNGYYRVQARGTNDQQQFIPSNPAIIAVRPVNDDWPGRITLQGTNAVATADFAAATRVSNDPKVAKILRDDSEGSTLWYQWTAPADGTVTIACSNWTIGMAVYTGKPGALKTVMTPKFDWHDNPGQFQAKAGVTYQIFLSDRYPVSAPRTAT